MIKAILLLGVSLISVVSNANCNFKVADFLLDINAPSSIKEIEIKIPKSAKFNRNFAKIVTSKSENIPPNLRKKFKANVIVRYDFGSCEYKAKVRQSGDWKDHVSFVNGMPLRSLNVRLKEGNILNAVSFKLLIPETRDNLDEVLGSVVLRELGYITPETFQVNTVINGVRSAMIFQENARKELLERNARREGPLFEGDESILWSFEDFSIFELESLALSRVTNPNWFLKGKNSQAITLGAYEKLQAAYLEYAQQYYKNGDQFSVFPNKRTSNTFEDYAFLLVAMNGYHALRPHNRRYYYNVFSREFEPVFYDGNFSPREPVKDITNLFFDSTFDDQYIFPHTQRMFSVDFRDKVFDSFLSRVLIDADTARDFFDDSLDQIKENINSLKAKASSLSHTVKSEKTKSLDKFNSYLSDESHFKVKQKKIVSVEAIGDEYALSDLKGSSIVATPKKVSKLISRNQVNGERGVYLVKKSIDKESKLVVQYIDAIKGSVIYPEGLNIQINRDERKVSVSQNRLTDWILFRNADLEGWLLSFNGKRRDNNDLVQGQRFNKYGMTGCLNLYRSTFNNTQMYVTGGMCEDSLNIVESQGSVKKIEVEESYADGVDLDFSNVLIDSILVRDAGNDCLDVSGGKYLLRDATFSRCGDKGISVGEKSKLSASKVEVNRATLGVSSKDSSIVDISNAALLNVPVCVEATQKKQEFSGARATFGVLNCKGRVSVGKDSIVEGVDEL